VPLGEFFLCFGKALGAFWGVFWSVFGGVLVPFCSLLECFGPFWSVLWRFVVAGAVLLCFGAF